MSRWQLRAVLLYSHDSRRRDIFFDLNAVNIITGPSGSGKSAICEIIDYCLGSGQCHVPGVVRDASSWVSILLANDSTQVFIARRIPPVDQFSSEDTYIAFGTHLNLPNDASGLTGTTNVSTMLRRLEQILGIGNVVTEVFGASRPQRPITARNITPFLIQDDDVIINKTVLLRGAQDERRMSIIDTFPYFLGAVDEGTVAKEQELRRLNTQYANEERRISSLGNQRDNAALALRGIAAEAKQVGLLDVSIEEATIESLRAELQRVADYVPLEDVEDEGDRLTSLVNTEKRLWSERVRLLTELDDLREAHEEAKTFVTTTERQQRRLQVVDLFSTANQPNEVCPVCSNPIMKNTETLGNVRAAYHELQGQLRSAERERPQIDQYIASLQDRIDGVSRQISIVRAQLIAVRKESTAIQEQLDIAQRRLKVAGRVSYFLEVADQAQAAPNSDQLTRLGTRIAELREELDQASKLDRLQEAQQQVAFAANDVLDSLPFAALYPQRAVYINTRDISAGILTAQRRIPMRDIGSDENYLSLHVAIALGLQRYFKIHSRPVPGFVVFDQLSRPFYPPDRMPGVVTTRSDAERGELRKYFDALFREVETQGDLQIIVLEHAYFADDERFVTAVGNRYLETEKLIPADWPGVPQ
jgi:predicted  nucleic acid-binding Zn-ribbon protein